MNTDTMTIDFTFNYFTLLSEQTSLFNDSAHEVIKTQEKYI